VGVFVNSNGQLGTLTSSARFKEEITDVGNRSNKLLQLRPVSFYYQPEFDDGSRSLQSGLIANEMAKVYPEPVGWIIPEKKAGVGQPGVDSSVQFFEPACQFGTMARLTETERVILASWGFAS
jgi:hypothetical protein